MIASGIGYSAAMGMGGLVTSMMVGDVLQAIPTKAEGIPATGSSATPKTTGDGKPVSGANTPRQNLFLSAGVVVGAMLVLLLGSRFFRDARIG